MVGTLKDSFWSLIKCVTYRQEKDEKLLKFLVLFSWQALLLCPQKLFWFCRYAVASLGSIYLPSANSICFRFAQTRYDINPRSRSEHIECDSTYRVCISRLWRGMQTISKIRFSGFISTRSVLKGTTQKTALFYSNIPLYLPRHFLSIAEIKLVVL